MCKRTSEKAQQFFAAYQNGDDNAFLALYDMFASLLLNYGACFTSDKEMVKDCVQDVFTKLITKRDCLKIDKVESYLFVSLRNRLNDEFRRCTNMSENPVENYKLSETTPDVETSYIDVENVHVDKIRVQTLLGSLTTRQRKAITLYYLEQRKYEEICDILQMDYNSARNLVHRGMMRLRAAAC